MKKILVVLFTTTLILSTSGCNVDKANSTSTKNTNETMNEADVTSSNESINEISEKDDLLKTCPIVTYDDISSGKYNGQIVCIDAVIDMMDNDLETSCNFSLWYPSGQSYVYDSLNSFYDVEPDSPEAVFLTAQNGDIVRYVTTVYEDGSFGTTSVEAATIVGKQNLDDLYNAFKANCPEINYEDMQRNSDAYKDTFFKLSGFVFQIVGESSSSAEYLIETEYGKVYVSWFLDENLRKTRFLENDNVAIYGEFWGLKTYNTLLGEKTVLEFSATLIDLSD